MEGRKMSKLGSDRQATSLLSMHSGHLNLQLLEVVAPLPSSAQGVVIRN